MKAARSSGGITVSISSNTPAQRSSTMSSRPKGPRVCGCAAQAPTPARRARRHKPRAPPGPTPCARHLRPDHARIDDGLGSPRWSPWDTSRAPRPPISATRPSTHVGTGSRSIIGFIHAAPLAARSAGTSSQGVAESLEMMDEIADLRRLEPAFSAPAPGAVDGDLRDPVDQGAPLRVGVGNRVDHHPLPPGAKPHEGRPGAQGPRPHRAAPHQRAAPVDRALIRGASGARIAE